MAPEKGESAERFWYIVERFKRPIILFKVNKKEKIPLYDYTSEEAAKIWSLKVQSPVAGEIVGAAGAAVDLFYSHKKDKRELEEHLNRQLGQSAQNLNQIVKASQTICDPRTPEGIRKYAEHQLLLIMKKQAEINNQIGLKVTSINTGV